MRKKLSSFFFGQSFLIVFLCLAFNCCHQPCCWLVWVKISILVRVKIPLFVDPILAKRRTILSFQFWDQLGVCLYFHWLLRLSCGGIERESNRTRLQVKTLNIRNVFICQIQSYHVHVVLAVGILISRC